MSGGAGSNLVSACQLRGRATESCVSVSGGAGSSLLSACQLRDRPTVLLRVSGEAWVQKAVGCETHRSQSSVAIRTVHNHRLRYAPFTIISVAIRTVHDHRLRYAPITIIVCDMLQWYTFFLTLCITPMHRYSPTSLAGLRSTTSSDEWPLANLRPNAAGNTIFVCTGGVYVCHK